jgi:DNA helicase IV
LKIKGLESPAVLVVDIERISTIPVDQWIQRLYCALTRPTVVLDVFYLRDCWDGKEDELFGYSTCQ